MPPTGGCFMTTSKSMFVIRGSMDFDGIDFCALFHVSAQANVLQYEADDVPVLASTLGHQWHQRCRTEKCSNHLACFRLGAFGGCAFVLACDPVWLWWALARCLICRVAGPVGHSRRFTVYIYIVLYINVLQQALQCCNRVVSRMHQSANAQGKSVPQQNIAFC